MRRLLIYLRLDGVRIALIGVLIAVFFIVNNSERFGGWTNWSPAGWSGILAGSIILVAIVRATWFFLLEPRTENTREDYAKFVEKTKVRKWL